MKKAFMIFAAVALMIGFGTSAMAANQVKVQANSEGITAAEGACEKAGSLKFIFDEGTVLQDGDWWYADLPLGVTLCKSIDFAVLGTAGAAVPNGGGGFVSLNVDAGDIPSGG